jgi:DNA polymerase III alpha subunit (gram-positive type)
MQSIMFDIETLGTAANSSILSIAAVKFEFKNDIVETFTVNIDPKSSKNYGMIVDPETVRWWTEQNPIALKEFMKNQISIDDALDQFTEFVGPNWKDTIFWVNGASFDYPILQWSYAATGRKHAPWKYWNQRDTRTIYEVFGLDWRNYPRVGTYHNAIDDCLTQIKALKECLS